MFYKRMQISFNLNSVLYSQAPQCCFHSVTSLSLFKCCILPLGPHCANKSTPPKTPVSPGCQVQRELFSPDFAWSFCSLWKLTTPWPFPPLDAMTPPLLVFPEGGIHTTDGRGIILGGTRSQPGLSTPCKVAASGSEPCLKCELCSEKVDSLLILFQFFWVKQRESQCGISTSLIPL